MLIGSASESQETDNRSRADCGGERIGRVEAQRFGASKVCSMVRLQSTT